MACLNTERNEGAKDKRRAAKELALATSANNMRGPVEVTSTSSKLVLSIMYNHVNMGSADGSRILSKKFMHADVET